MDMSKKRISVTKENKNGRNLKFKDNVTGEEYTRAEFVNAIQNGKYPDYYVRKMNGIPTPVSKPDKNKDNNLG